MNNVLTLLPPFNLVSSSLTSTLLMVIFQQQRGDHITLQLEIFPNFLLSKDEVQNLHSVYLPDFFFYLHLSFVKWSLNPASCFILLLTLSKFCLDPYSVLNSTSHHSSFKDKVQIFFCEAFLNSTHYKRTPPLFSLSILSSSFQPHGLSPPGSSAHGNFPGENTGVGCHAFLKNASCSSLNFH